MNQLTHKELTQDDLDMYFFYRKYGIREGFFKRYFLLLPAARNNIEAFNNANDEFFTLFSEYRYSTYNSFGNNLKIYLGNETN